MALASFPGSLKHVLVYEGAYVNHPKDPGGPTMKGVTQRVYDGFRDRSGLSRRTVRQITDAELGTIYRRQYWDAIRGDDLPVGVDFVVFDGAVNSGVSRSIKWLQRALGAKVDGHLGEATIAAAKNHPDTDALISEICRARLAFLKSLKTWPTFGKGWAIRVKSVDDIGRGMTPSEHVAVSIEHTEAFEADTSGKADAPPVSEQKTGITEAAATGGGFSISALLYLAWDHVSKSPEATIDALTSFAQQKPEVLAFAVVAAGLIYIGWRRYQQKQAVDA